jgi:hypothetical protein
MGIRNRGRNVHFGEKNRFRQSAPVRQVAGQGRGERTSGAMRGFRALTVRLENFHLRAPGGTKAQEIDRLLQVASGNHHVRRSESV